MERSVSRVRVVDSHTEGEPTRVVVEGAPVLRAKTPVEAVAELREEHDAFRSGVVLEPRGSEVVVGALLMEPTTPDAVAGVVFFNNVGYLGMCGHGTIGLVATLAYLGRIGPGVHGIETPVGTVHAELHEDGRVSVANVSSYRLQKAVPVEVPGYGVVHGDIAYGGNWFFLVEDHGLDLSLANLAKVNAFSLALRAQLEAQGITGADGAEIDHIELVGPPTRSDADRRNFVLCPGAAYDRSPCGTGTSAKLACLAADGKLAEGEIWGQESIIGSLFQGRYTRGEDGAIHPVVTGRAYVTADAILLFDSEDPFVAGIGA
ncbi:MAG: proline racemase family protein [Fimbriimonas sp.]